MLRHRPSRPACFWGAAVVLLGTCVASAITLAEPRTTLSDGAGGSIEFRTYTPASQRPLITRSYLNEPTTVISGVLSLPTKLTFQREGKSPAVILAHGTGGVSNEREYAWAKRLNSWGIAAFIVDSYTGRGIKPPIYSDNPRFTHVAAHLVDAYLALQLISTHPKIDRTRVAVMGFSRGGEAAVNAVFERFRVRSGPRRTGSRPTFRSIPIATSGTRANRWRRRRCSCCWAAPTR